MNGGINAYAKYVENYIKDDEVKKISCDRNQCAASITQKLFQLTDNPRPYEG